MLCRPAGLIMWIRECRQLRGAVSLRIATLVVSLCIWIWLTGLEHGVAKRRLLALLNCHRSLIHMTGLDCYSIFCNMWYSLTFFIGLQMGGQYCRHCLPGMPQWRSTNFSNYSWIIFAGQMTWLHTRDRLVWQSPPVSLALVIPGHSVIKDVPNLPQLHQPPTRTTDLIDRWVKLG